MNRRVPSGSHLTLLTLIALSLLLALTLPQPAAGAHEGATLTAQVADDEQTYVFEVRTLPVTPDVVFSLDGETQTTGSDGAALFILETTPGGGLDLTRQGRLEIETTEVTLDPTRRAQFARWQGLGSARSTVTAQMNIEYRVAFELRDVRGDPVDPDRIDEMTLKSSTGEVRSINVSDSPWLLGTRITRSTNSYDEKPVFWTVQTATDSGLDVVRRSATKFFPEADRIVVVETLYFSARFEIADAFFGFPTGETLVIETPTNQTLIEPIVDGVVSLEQMARGEYIVTIEGQGMRMSRPVSITRNQDVELKLYTWLDISLVGGAGFFFAVTPIFLGLRARRRQRRAGQGLRKMGQQGAASGQAAKKAATRKAVVRRAKPELTSNSRSERRTIGIDRFSAPLRSAQRRAPQLATIAIAAALLLSASFVTPAASAQSTPVEPGDPAVLAHYYIWFDASSWNRAKIDFPELGRYSSDEESTMRRHVEEAKAAGIDGFIVSWKSTDVNNVRLEQLIGIAEELDFQLVMSYQALDFNREPLPVARIEQDLDHFIDSYASSPAFDLFARPTMVLAGTWKFTVDELARITADRRSALLILASEKNVEGYERVAEVVDGDLYYWSSVDPRTNARHGPKLIDMAAAVHDHGGIWIAPATPGFDARAVGGTSVVERRDGETLRLSWQAALNSLPEAIGVISWNEFSENTHIEPSANYGAASLAVLADLTGAPDVGAIDFDSSGPSSRPGLSSSSQPEQSYGRVMAGGLFALLIVSSLVAIRRRSGDSPDTDTSDPGDDV